MNAEPISDRRPTLADAQAAARRFLQEALPDVYRIDITRVAPGMSADTAWEAEAVVWQPNAAVAALGLPTSRPILDRNVYVVQIDGRLDVVGYEAKQAEDAS